MAWIEETGLLLDIVGAIVLAAGLLIGKQRALELGVTRYAGSTDEENLKLPQVRDRLLQARNAKVGVVFLVSGFACQFIANLPG